MSAPFSYDEIPYPGRAFVQTHPDRLATMATLFGLDAAPPATCRVLELGCGDGANLLPMALGLPGSTFTGIDLSARAIEQARSRATELGLGNVAFEQLGFDDYDPPAASFDYVIAHGVYSWIPPAVRDRLMAICARALSPHGVAYVSYNALPGHAMRQTLRDLLAFELRGVEHPTERMAAARALLTECCEVWGAGEGQEATLGGQARMLLAQSDVLFFHDTLSPDNKAPYFVEFAAHAGAHGLQFLAEAEFTEMQTGGFAPEVRARVHAIADVVQREQLIDFLKQRMFRQTLLCHAAVTLDRVARPHRIATLAASGPVESETDPETGRVMFKGPGGADISTAHAPLIAALRRVGARWPGAIWISELADAPPSEGGDAGDADAAGEPPSEGGEADAAGEPPSESGEADAAGEPPSEGGEADAAGEPPSDPAAPPTASQDGDRARDERLATLCQMLLPCFAANVVRLHVHPPAVVSVAGEFPRASVLARLQARERGRATITTLRHTNGRPEDELGWRLIPLLDGTRDRAALLAAVAGEGQAGAGPQLAIEIERSLAMLARGALLEA